MREPMIISFSRFQVVWAELWLQLTVEIRKWAEPYRDDAQFIVDAWEGEWPDES